MDLGINPEELTLQKEKDWIKKTIAEYSQPNPQNFNWAIMTELEVSVLDKPKKIEEKFTDMTNAYQKRVSGRLGRNKKNYFFFLAFLGEDFVLVLFFSLLLLADFFPASF